MARHLHLKKEKDKQQLMGTAATIWVTAKNKNSNQSVQNSATC